MKPGVAHCHHPTSCLTPRPLIYILVFLFYLCNIFVIVHFLFINLQSHIWPSQRFYHTLLLQVHTWIPINHVTTAPFWWFSCLFLFSPSVYQHAQSHRERIRLLMRQCFHMKGGDALISFSISTDNSAHQPLTHDPNKTSKIHFHTFQAFFFFNHSVGPFGASCFSRQQLPGLSV